MIKMATHLDRFILGVNPFAGTSHFSSERARERGIWASENSVSKIMESAFEAGATGFNLATDARGFSLLNQLGDLETSSKIGLYVLIPDIRKYVSSQLSKGTVGMLTDALSELNLGARARVLVRGGLSVLTLDPVRAIKVFLDLEVGRLQNRIPQNAQLKSVIVHEAVTDTALALGATSLLESFVEYFRDKDVLPGFVTRNFPLFLRFCRSTDLPLEKIVIMTPFNKIGFQMTPSREECEEGLKKVGDANLIAMSILAGGQIPLTDAVIYLKSLSQTKSLVVGVSSTTQAIETFKTLRTAWS